MAESENKQIVVKVQRSLASNVPGEHVLVYDESREYQFQGEMPADLRKMMGDEPKIYCKAELVPNEDDPETFQISIGEITDDQEW